MSLVKKIKTRHPDVMRDGVIYAREANLIGADLGWANLYEANLRGANLRGANLEGANLIGADLGWANLYEANLSEADLSWANLYEANLIGADLGWANLYEANLRGANLRGANLEGANLRCTNLIGANLPNAPQIPTLAAIDSQILNQIQNGGALEMDAWHTCKTTHCRAGWAIHLCGEAGYALEKLVGSNAAGALIYAKSRPDMRVPDWLASNEEALADLQQCATMEETKCTD